jgi:hypothetical protein
MITPKHYTLRVSEGNSIHVIAVSDEDAQSFAKSCGFDLADARTEWKNQDNAWSTSAYKEAVVRSHTTMS